MNFWRKRKNVLVLGSDGMLGYDLYQRLRQMSARGEIGVVYGMSGDELRNMRAA